MANQEQLLTIERCFLRLMESPQDEFALNEIGSVLQDLFKYEFTVTVVSPSPDRPEMFIMSVYPEESTMNKIISALSTGKGLRDDGKVIEKLWRENKKWTIEIDGKIFTTNPKFTERELTAMLLHEVGHITNSNKVTSRIHYILQYEIAKTNIGMKSLASNKLMAGIMSLPILMACGSNKKDNIKEEIKADKFVRKMGYQKFLITALQKLSQMKAFKNVNDSVGVATSDAISMVDQFAKRKDELLKKRLINYIGESTSPYVTEVVNKTYKELYKPVVYQTESESTFPMKDRLERLHDEADMQRLKDLFIYNDMSDVATYVERPDIFKKRLKRIDPVDIDYAMVQASAIKTDDDKMLAISWARHKLDIVNYYLALYTSNSTGKYIIPNTQQELASFKKKLELAIEKAYKVDTKRRDPYLLIQWPAGYDG